MTTEISDSGISGGISRDIADFNVDGLETNDTASGRRRTLNPSAMRELIPVDGLHEYWYPAIVERKVGRHRPSKIKLLNEDVVLFRNKQGAVVACAPVCPHRGGSIGDGHCHFAGTISCPYHGWTFDETGDCVAVLGEGPDSPIPGNEGARLKMYPTVTLKGVVFVWMGSQEPAPLEEDIPPQFFLDNVEVQVSVSNWSCNWRQAIENIGDAHVFYVHHTSFNFMSSSDQQLRGSKNGPTRARPRIVNHRGVNWPADAMGRTMGRDPSDGYRDSYSGLSGQLWPKHEFLRLQWARLMNKTTPFRPKIDPNPPWRSDEWSGFHLPSMFRAFDTGHYVYTRVCIPIDADNSRMFYFYTTQKRSTTEHFRNVLWFKAINNWWLNYNFSGQDQAVMEPQVYNQPEALSATDVYPLAIRRLIVEQGRDFQEVKPKE